MLLSFYVTSFSSRNIIFATQYFERNFTINVKIHQIKSVITLIKVVWWSKLWRQVGQSPIKLTQDKQEFWFHFCDFLVRISQGLYRSWKTWKVIFQVWKVMEFRCRSSKVMENQYALYKWKAVRSKLEKLTDQSKNQN